MRTCSKEMEAAAECSVEIVEAMPSCPRVVTATRGCRHGHEVAIRRSGRSYLPRKHGATTAAEAEAVGLIIQPSHLRTPGGPQLRSQVAGSIKARGPSVAGARRAAAAAMPARAHAASATEVVIISGSSSSSSGGGDGGCDSKAANRGWRRRNTEAGQGARAGAAAAAAAGQRGSAGSGRRGRAAPGGGDRRVCPRGKDVAVTVTYGDTGLTPLLYTSLASEGRGVLYTNSATCLPLPERYLRMWFPALAGRSGDSGSGTHSEWDSSSDSEAEGGGRKGVSAGSTGAPLGTGEGGGGSCERYSRERDGSRKRKPHRPHRRVGFFRFLASKRLRLSIEVMDCDDREPRYQRLRGPHVVTIKTSRGQEAYSLM